MLDIINEECGISVICKKNKLDCLKSLSAYEDDHELNLTAYEEVNILNNISCISESFSDEVTDILMEDCLGPFYQIFNQLEDYSNDEKIAYCYINSIFPDVDPPNCVGCSVGEAQVVWEDEIKALNMLECAISKLDNFNGSTPTDVKVALETHFGGTNSTLVSEYIKNIFKYIRSYPYDRGYQADDDCGNGVIAWSFPSVHFTDVRLCRPLYWQKFEIERSGTLIHEWMHLYYFAGDISYDWEEDYQELSTLQALLNADSFSEFVKEICDE